MPDTVLVYNKGTIVKIGDRKYKILYRDPIASKILGEDCYTCKVLGGSCVDSYPVSLMVKI